jgi:hypothetical protein
LMINFKKKSQNDKKKKEIKRMSIELEK